MALTSPLTSLKGLLKRKEPSFPDLEAMKKLQGKSLKVLCSRSMSQYPLTESQPCIHNFLTFVASNCLLTERIERVLEMPPTQLFIIVDAPNEELLNLIARPIIKN